VIKSRKDEGVFFKPEADALVSYSDTIIIPGILQFFDIGNLGDLLSILHLFNCQGNFVF
jgi:hypothetical protein